MLRSPLGAALMLSSLMFTSSTASSQEIRIAAASDLSAAFKHLGAAYEKKTGNPVKLSFGSSGNFFSQIRNGAPFDLFFSADLSYPQQLLQAGLAAPDSLYEYAVGRLVVWSPKSSKLDVQKFGLQVLRQPAVRKIAIANPQHAPYGRAAVDALRREKLYDELRDKLVFGENISQAAQFVQSGNADVGLIALSLALSPQMREAGNYWLIPEDSYPPLVQAGVVLKQSSHKAAAQAFVDFLKSPDGKAIMEQYGFKPPATHP